MKVSTAGRTLIEAREGCKLVAYPDPASGGEPWTIGYGHTGGMSGKKVVPGMRITAAQADAFLEADLAPVEQVLNALGVPLLQHQFDALASWIFNVGIGRETPTREGFLGSTVRRRILAGNIAGVVPSLLLWKKPASIIPRRQAEADQFAGIRFMARRGEAPIVIYPVPSSAPAQIPIAPQPSGSSPALASAPPATQKAEPMNPISGMFAAAQAFEAVAPKLISMGTTAFKNRDDLAKQASRIVTDLGKLQQDFAHLDISSASADIGDAWKAGQQVFVDAGISYATVTDTVKALPGIPAIGSIEAIAAQAEALGKKLGLPV